jgi:trimeric autotransporter adhesin
MFNTTRLYSCTGQGRKSLLTITSKVLLFATCCLAVSRLYGQPAPFADPKFWMTDGPVNAIQATNGAVYLGGDFSYVGPRTGPSALFDQASGGLLSATAPRINGVVKAIVSDGAGGWFVGGTFTRIGSAPITNVAHLNPDLSLDTRWNARLLGSTINALALDSGVLYLGGTFTRINGQVLSGGLAGVNATNPVVTWNPLLSGSVNAMQVVGSLVYAGGNFFSVGNSNVQNLAAISTTTALATAFNPSTVDQQVLALFVTANNIYVGGQFTTIGTKSKNRLAALDLVQGVANNWNPNPNGIVRALWVTSSNAFVGGDFTTISLTSRRGFASVGLTGTGTAQPLDLQLQSVSTANLVRSLLLQGNSLYVGGQFVSNSLALRQPLVTGVDITTSSPIPVPLGSDFNGAAGAAFGANALAAANGRVLVGGDFQSLGGVTRQRAAALALDSGAALPWAPGFDAPVLCMAFGSSNLFVGGSFTNIIRPTKTNFVNSLAAVDLVNGTNQPFSFLATNSFSPVTVSALALGPNGLYAGGAFTVVGGQARRFVAALDPGTGNVIPGFNAALGGGFAGISAMALSGTNLYLGGDFTTVNSVAIPRLVSVSPVTGSSRNWVPNPNQPVTLLAVSTDMLYAGGSFTSVNPGGSGAITLNHFAAFSLLDNSLVNIDASLKSFDTVTGLAATPTVIYLGGSFTSLGSGGDSRQNLGAMSSLDATAYDWNPSPDLGPNVITLTDDYAFVGGQFRFMGQSPTNQASGFFAAFQRTPQTSIAKSGANVQIITTTGDRTDAVLQGSPSLSAPAWSSIQTNSTPGFSWTLSVPVTPPQRYFRVVAR